MRCKKGSVTGPGEPIAGDTSSQLGPSIRKAATAPAFCTQLPTAGGRFAGRGHSSSLSLDPRLQSALLSGPPFPDSSNSSRAGPWASPHLQFWGSPDGKMFREPALLRSPSYQHREAPWGMTSQGGLPPPCPPGPDSSVHPVMSRMTLLHHEPKPGANRHGKMVSWEPGLEKSCLEE